MRKPRAEKPVVCHPGMRYYAKGLCRSCYNKDLDKRNPGHYRRQYEACREWHNENRSKVNEAARKTWQARWLKKNYNLTVNQYNNMCKAQENVCAICHNPPKKRRLVVDHCHKTGIIRGLLCWRCNYGLTWFRDNPDNFRSAASYLERRQQS